MGLLVLVVIETILYSLKEQGEQRLGVNHFPWRVYFHLRVQSHIKSV